MTLKFPLPTQENLMVKSVADYMLSDEGLEIMQKSLDPAIQNEVIGKSFLAGARAQKKNIIESVSLN
jgi:hypothetical protein